MAGGAEHDEVLGIVAVKQIAGEMNRVELQCLRMLATLRACVPGLLTERSLEVTHLRLMDHIQADMEEKPGKNEPEYS